VVLLAEHPISLLKLPLPVVLLMLLLPAALLISRKKTYRLRFCLRRWRQQIIRSTRQHIPGIAGLTGDF